MIKQCTLCKKDFEPWCSIARFCSHECHSESRRFWKNASEEEKRQRIEDIFNKFVIKNDTGCWDWRGSKNKGYGQLNCGGRQTKMMFAHRVSWIIHKGPIPQGSQVLHKCDNPKCSNPDHLYIGGYKENMHDMISKGRSSVIGAKGEKNPRAILTLEKVKQIKQLLKSKTSVKDIANNFGVHQLTIYAIRKGINWKDV